MRRFSCLIVGWQNAEVFDILPQGSVEYFVVVQIGGMNMSEIAISVLQLLAFWHISRVKSLAVILRQGYYDALRV